MIKPSTYGNLEPHQVGKNPRYASSEHYKDTLVDEDKASLSNQVNLVMLTEMKQSSNVKRTMAGSGTLFKIKKQQN